LNESVLRAILAKLICRCYGWKFTVAIDEGFYFGHRGGWGGLDHFMTWEEAGHLDLDTFPPLGDQ
jgi:hypothetical protein